MKEFKHQDYGIINFGNTHRGKNWNDPSVNRHWLEYVISDECLTSDANKEVARKVLAQKNICDGQLEMF